MTGKSIKPKVETFCDMVARKAELKELKSVARGAKHICSECGRSAGLAERLCDPKKL